MSDKKLESRIEKLENDNKKYNVLVIKTKTTLQCIISDTFSIGIIVFCFWANYRYIGGNDILDCFLIVLFFIFGNSKINKKSLSKENAISEIERSK